MNDRDDPQLSVHVTLSWPTDDRAYTLRLRRSQLPYAVKVLDVMLIATMEVLQRRADAGQLAEEDVP